MPSVNDISFIDLPSIKDPRGILTSVESSGDIPFEIKRIFYMHHIVSARGGHAHTDTDQVVIAVSGCFRIELYDGKESTTFIMSDPMKGLYIPRMIFINLSQFSDNAVCLVLASTHYDIRKSYRTIDDYIKAVNP